MMFSIFNSRAAHLKLADLVLRLSYPLLGLENELSKRGWRVESLEDATNHLHQFARSRLEKAGYTQNPSYVSIHEAGHAIFALHAPGFGKVRAASIFPHDGMGGWVFTLDKDFNALTEAELLNVVAMNLAGFSGEILKYGPQAFRELRGDLPPSCETGDMITARRYARAYMKRFPSGKFNSTDDVIVEAQKIADQVIERFWAETVSLAEELERQYLLVESEILATITQSYQEPAPAT